MTDDEIDAHLDAVLRASGSALKHYSMHSTRQAMRAAMRAAVAAPQPSAKVNAMTEITRFSLDMDGSMDPDENGRWVFYDDFVTLTSEHAPSERSHAAAIHGLRAAVDGLMAANAEIQGLCAKLERAERSEGWRDHVEQRIRSWKQSTMSRSGDHLALDDFMGAADIDDLVDFVCDEWAEPTSAPAAETAPFPARRAVEREIERTENPSGLHLNDGQERVALPAGTLRYMLALIDRNALDVARARAEVVFPAAKRAQIARAFADYEGPEYSGKYPTAKGTPEPAPPPAPVVKPVPGCLDCERAVCDVCAPQSRRGALAFRPAAKEQSND